MAGQPGDEPVEPDAGGDAVENQEGAESTDGLTMTGNSAAWIRERAATIGLEPETYLERVVVSLRAVEAGDPRDDLATAEEYAALEERVDSLDDALQTKIQDVRERVVQVKRETDGKAPVDHGHPELREDVATGLDRARQAKERTASLEETVDTIESRLERGFENYEEILEYLVDRTDDLSEDLLSLQSATDALVRHLQVLRSRGQRRQRTDELKEAANRKGVTEARCDSCGSDVTVALLTEPACPVCNADVAGVTPKQGFFGSATLDTGVPPALEKPDESPADELANLTEEPTGRAAETDRDGGTDPTAILDEDGSLVDAEPVDSESTVERQESRNE
ncbi:Uncharacterized protein HSRCO_2422 [Halanaeroarchaeum sp. HSR-CO]|uniref:hypothetical protein n=1 Tax=Halanaeroarchaeum sp. HSR-CO TaxID=2866382 RepID=UPI00217E0480|nr:hypothetical protein [Halanaeroarchaeum sp. HSR-CO]UWG48686.1 Uncharacterized protein HSRCO_2422 [Halanaeroarchaeum sp. HSR-CO]